MEEQKEQECSVMESIKNLVETELKEILTIGIQQDNIDNLGKLIDIHKDIENEKYWEIKEEGYNMRYREHGYGADGYGAEEYGRSYGRRGVPGTGRGRYRGPEHMLDQMHEHYGNYSAANESASRGNYGAEADMMTSLEYMLKAACQFLDMLEEDASSSEERHLIKEYRRKIGEK